MRIGIDLGGTKIEGINLAPNGEIADRVRLATPRGDYPGTIETIREIADQLDPGAKRPVGLGIPGSLSPATGLVRNANSTWLIGESFDKDLEAALGRPIRIVNDADCFALSEASDGAGKGNRCVFGVILGTGTGGGVVVDGKLLSGPSRVAGEWGHSPLPWPVETETPGPDCYCGKKSCVETWLSGPGLARDHARVEAENLTGVEFNQAVRNRQEPALRTLERYCDRAARALTGVIHILDPDVIVLGGGVSNIDGLSDMIEPRLSDYVLSDTVRNRVIKNAHGDSSGVRGAAWLWPEE